MRRARPQELRTQAVPVLTARLTAAELSKWVPVQFEEITDPLEAPEPSKGALVRLDNGDYVVLFYGRDSHQLIVEIPETTKDSSAVLAAFFREVPIPASRVLWLRSGAELPKTKRLRRSTSRDTRGREDHSEAAATAPTVRAKRSALRATIPTKRR